MRFQTPQFVSKSAAVDSRQPPTQFAESFRAVKKETNNPQLPFSAD